MSYQLVYIQPFEMGLGLNLCGTDQEYKCALIGMRLLSLISTTPKSQIECIGWVAVGTIHEAQRLSSGHYGVIMTLNVFTHLNWPSTLVSSQPVLTISECQLWKALKN
ncbi:hypothetical protein [Pseudomonas sp. CJQ_13]|uniref:hypothetical protein n=1 Tax=Pseudomonas sp. CJQ_13 TaxID=3367170 RepID=UPI003709E7DE